MREPQPDNWERFLSEKIRERDELQVARVNATPWEEDDIRAMLDQVYFEIECAENALGIVREEA